MSTNRRDTFMQRASLFASPVDSSSVPKKRVAREGPRPALVFDEEPRQSSSILSVSNQPSLIHEQEEAGEEVFEDEPMEVDTSSMPSPVKSQRSDRPSLPDSLQLSPEKSLEAMESVAAPENVPCTRATTPRRKSMPTPGKKLAFSSREFENLNEDKQKADESSLLELLVANNPEEIPKNVKATVIDKKEMTQYLDHLKKEMAKMKTIRQNRETLLQKAKEQSEGRCISSTVVSSSQAALFDLTIHREESAEEKVKRLYANFTGNTQGAGKQLIARKKAEAAERETEILQSKLHRIQQVEEKHSNLEKELLEKYRKEQEALEETSERMRHAYQLADSLQTIDFCF